MKRASVFSTSVCLAYLLAGCGSSPQTTTSPADEGGSKSSNAGGNKSNTSAGGNTSSSLSTSKTGTSASTPQSTSTSQGGSPGTDNPGQGGTNPSGSVVGSKGGSSAGVNPPGKGGSSAANPAGGTSNATPAAGGALTQGGRAAQAGRGNQGGKSPGVGGSTDGTKPTGDGGSPPGAGGSSTPSAAGTGSTQPPTEGEIPQVVTSADKDFWKVGTYTTSSSGNADVTVNDSGSTRWDGFGGCFNEAGWDALAVLSESDRQLALKLLYSATEGANFAYGRIPIGASDYAMSRYTLAETAGDYTMDKFSIERDKKQLIPYIQAAIAVKPDIHFWASPWTPPAWMKDNNNTDDGNMKDDAKILDAFALYLEKFVTEYGKEGIKIEAIHPQNEPGYVNPYPSCKWSSDLYIKFIRDYLGPKFKTDNVPAEIWCGTMSAESDGTIATTLAADSKAMGYVKGFGLQWNTKAQVGTLKSKGSVMQTEHKCGNYSFSTPNWSGTYDANKPQNDYAYGIESWKNIKEWVTAGVNSYSAWNMVLDTSGANLNTQKPWHQNALLVVDRGAKKLIQTPAYYVFRHLSQYVAPGGKVLSTSGGDALAFKNPDGSYVTVLYNSGAAKSMTVSVGGAKLQFSAPNNGWATVYYKK